MSLADELLADLEEAGLEGEEAIAEEQEEDGIGGIEDIDDVDGMDTGQGGMDPEGICNVARSVSMLSLWWLPINLGIIASYLILIYVHAA